MDEQQFHDLFYDREAERIFSSPLYCELLALHVRFLLDVTSGLSTARILSIGCGDGRRELAMAKHAGHIVGIDLSPVAIARATQRAEQLGIRNVSFAVDDADRLSEWAMPPFDAIWCGGVLHHLCNERIDTLLRSARSALRSGGYFVSMDPSSRRLANLFKPLFRRQYERYHSPGERELCPLQVQRQLEAAGYAEVEIHFTDWFISPLAWTLPRLSGPVAPLLTHLDRILTRMPGVRQLSSGFAAVARKRGE